MLIGIAATVLVLVGGLWLLQRRLIYLPEGDVPPLASVLPGWEQVELTTSDDLTLAGWFTAPPDDAPIVIVFNGNADNRAGRVVLGSRFAAAGYGVLLFDYRGYGGNPGQPTESGLARDARAALDYVEAHAPENPLVYFGESLGAAVAVELASVRPPAALVLRSPFTSLPDAARVHYPFLPVGMLLWDDYPSLARIASVNAPLLVVAGSADTIIPIDQSRTLYEAASEPKDLLVVDGADHNDVALAAGSQMIDAVVEFVDGQTRS